MGLIWTREQSRLVVAWCRVATEWEGGTFHSSPNAYTDIVLIEIEFDLVYVFLDSTIVTVFL